MGSETIKVSLQPFVQGIGRVGGLAFPFVRGASLIGLPIWIIVAVVSVRYRFKNGPKAFYLGDNVALSDISRFVVECSFDRIVGYPLSRGVSGEGASEIMQRKV